MGRIELKILQAAESKKDALFFVAITVFGVAVRVLGRGHISGDMNIFLLPWYEMIKENGGFVALREQTGDYGIPYQVLIAAMTYIPLSPLYLYKILSCVFDFGLAFASAKFACALRREKSAFLFCSVYGAVLISPTVVFNSSVWGQCDSIYVFFLMLVCWCLYLERYWAAFTWLGVAFAFKLQAVFVLPFLFFYYVKEKKISLFFGLGTSIAAFYAMQLPGLVMGRSLLDPIRIYLGQAGANQNMWLNYPSFWVMIGDDYANLKPIAILLTACVLGMGLYALMHGADGLAHGGAFLGMLVWSAWTCVLFLPSMHERYGYFIDILVTVQAFVSAGTAPDGCRKACLGGYAAAEIMCSIAVYGNYLYGAGNDLRVWSAVNMVAYFCCLLHAAKSVRACRTSDV